MRALLAHRVSLTWFLLWTIGLGALCLFAALVIRAQPPQGIVVYSGEGQVGAPPQSAEEAAAQVAIVLSTPTSTPSVTTLSAPALPSATATSAPSQPSPTLSPTPATITVYVSGAVTNPGLYTLAEGSRIASAIEAAGGLLATADPNAINMAERLADEAHVAVYEKGAAAPATAARSTKATRTAAPPKPTIVPAATPAFPLNINTATPGELDALPGIGPTLAGRIVADRAQNGPFASVDDLTRVSGIGNAIVEKVRPFVVTGP